MQTSMLTAESKQEESKERENTSERAKSVEASHSYHQALNSRTLQAEAILLLHSIPCTGYAFQGPAAWSQLLVYVEAYFAPFTSSTESKIRQTNLSPIFLQRPHHSLTIVGFERTKSGQRRLLVFDPAWRPRRLMEPRSATLCSRWIAYWTLNSYSKGERYLKRFKAFETLAIDRPVLEKHSN